MGEHSLSVRMQQKIDTVANWAKATNFVPKKGEIIVYSDGSGVGVPKIKVGDGTTVVGSLKFLEADKTLTATEIETALGYKPEEETPKAQTDTATLGTELISSNGWILGTGWSGNLQSGFTHTSGTALLSYTMPENTINNYYQVSFKSSVAMTDSNLFVSVGNSPLFNLYFEEHDDGTISIGVLAAENGNLSFTPSTDYNGVISEVSIRRVISTYQPIKQLLDISGKVSTEIYITPQEQNNLYIGLNAGSLNTTGNRNVGIGANALKKNLSGWRNIAVGSGALQNNTAGTRNIAIGEDSMPSMQSGQRNIAIGTSTMTLIKNGNRNIAIGADSLFLAEESNDCIGIGFAALNLNKGNTNYGIGTRALYSTTGNKNIAIGYDTGHNITSGSENTLVGAAAGYNLKTGKNNVAIGPYAAKGTTNSDQSHYNIAIGYGAAQNIGRYSSYNVVIGPNTATSLSGADHCIVIGANQDVDTDNNYQLNIGGLIKGSLNPNEAFLKINGGLELPNIPSSAPQNIGRIWNDNGVLRIKQEGEETEPYLTSLPIASSSTLGGIIAGEGLSITTEGTLSVSKIPNSLTLNGTSFDGSSAVTLSSQQLGVPSAFIAKSVSTLDCNNEKIGRVLSSSASNTLTNGPAEIGSTGAGVLWNIPALNDPTSIVNESGTWQYLHQIFITGTSGRIYLRSSSSDGTAGNWSYGEWAKVLTDKNFTNTVKLSSGGVNLLTNTKSFIDGNYTIKGTLQSETYNGFAVRQGVNSSDDAALIIQYSPALEANKSYTLSFWAKGSGSIQALITGYSQPCSSISSENTISTDDGGANTFPLTSSWKRYWITFTMGNWSFAASGKVLWLRARTQDGSGTVANVCGLKWENGNIATDWTPALGDQKIGGTNYLPNLLLKGTQTNITTTYDSSTGVYTLTGNGSTNTAFPQLYSLSLPCENLAGKTCVFHVDSIIASNTALEPRVYVTFQDSSGATLVSGLVSLYTSSVTIDVPSTAVSYQYIIRLDQNKAHATTDTATFKGLKLEIGNTPTNWSPAPEDIKHETSSRLVLLSTAWTGSGPYSATLACSHITASNTVIVSMAAPVSQVQYETFCKAQITANAQTDGSISFTAYGTKPTINLPIAITTLGG